MGFSFRLFIATHTTELIERKHDTPIKKIVEDKGQVIQFWLSTKYVN